MAASTRAVTPTHTGHFPGANAPDTPTSLSSVQQSIGNSTAHDFGSNPSLPPSNPSSTFGAHLTNSPKHLSPRVSPQPLTGAAAMADERRQREEKSRQTSPNPALAVVQNLLGTDSNSMSRPKDAPPAPTQLSEPMATVAKSIVIPDQQPQAATDAIHTSPVSLSSFCSADSTTAPTATAHEATAGPILGGLAAPEPPSQQNVPIAPNPGDAPSNRAYTFPGPLQPEQDPRAPQRGMSLPFPQNSPKSPSTKRHKCPYCSTDFTRHHNLKSHLLTHSQEKPYECPTCQARFRRLHDLKRHTKLHTGERPHTCPKCGRRFARGDALARHNKGQGGCAGRRSSFGVDEEMPDAKGDEAMDGIIYDNEDRGDDDEHDGAGGRRVSEPVRKRQNTTGSASGPYHQHSSTYPPLAANRAQMGNNNLRPLYPPGAGSIRDQATNISPKGAGSSISSVHFNTNPAGVFAQGGMTESPKPLSPGQDPHRLGVPEGASIPGARSPTMSQQIHQQSLARGAGRGSPSMTYPHPHAPNNAAQLPSLPGLTPSLPVPGKGAKGSGPNMLQHPVPGSGSNPGSLSSHDTSSGGSMREIAQNQGIDIWQYIRDMEARMAAMTREHQEQMGRLQNEVTTLRGQLAQSQSVQPGPQQPQPGH